MEEIERLPWWLGGGEERCRICLQRYAVQVEVRCVECDLGGCPFCTALIEGSRDRWCVDCVPVRRGGDSAPERSRHEAARPQTRERRAGAAAAQA